ncbi:hypothetical protein SAMN04487895_106354 [Paenibacillus sophorae]|uniref:Uncharacterized protein n=1 Tax=Paenibacillus sophorae TaxID=1333845 RepID=A0A1H8NPP8_9BACL|nr:hypothetical protein [Paenibacillus sophorae]QWU18567.1 hypothetical protein KP014_21640 [Paenibacillus sophorae]SEO31681.1 hypothetical protein SAMN04487895_106354 [Paenibacillus sophorae]
MASDGNDQAIKWYTETMQFDTMREAHEWAYHEAYKEIGNVYDGYLTKDEK